MKKIFLSLVLLSLVFVSGCTDFPGMESLFGPGEGGEKVVEESPDILVIENKNIIPNPPINANDDFTLSFTVKNQDDISEVENVEMQLYDWGVCKPGDNADFTSETGKYTKPLGAGGTLSPQQEDYVELEFTSPDNDQIAEMEATCPVRYRVNYDYEAKTQVDMMVISKEELKQKERAGESVYFTPTETIGRGPIKVYIRFGKSSPVETGEVLPVFIDIEDKGSGSIGSEIKNEVGGEVLRFYVPIDFTVIKECNKLTLLEETETEGNMEYNIWELKEHACHIKPDRTDENTENFCNGKSTKEECENADFSVCYWEGESIAMVKKKSSPQIRCSFTVPSEEDVPVQKTYNFYADMTYSYNLDGEDEIKIKPTLEV